tara:strand:- start:14323 stop:14976 length:654 start_codon:yes stop_codon:yes gene_type:complete
MNITQESSPIYGIKSKKNRYLESSDGFSQLTQFPGKDLMIGITDTEVCCHAYDSEHYAPESIAEEHVLEDEAVMRGNNLFIFDTLVIHNQLTFFMIHKSPYVTHKSIEGAYFHMLPLNDVSPGVIKSYLSNPSVTISEHTKKYIDVYQLAPSRRYDLTSRQLQCLNLLVKGYSASDIAFELNISKRTVECHICTIKEKLDVRKISELVMKVFSEGIL